MTPYETRDLMEIAVIYYFLQEKVDSETFVNLNNGRVYFRFFNPEALDILRSLKADQLLVNPRELRDNIARIKEHMYSILPKKPLKP